MAELPLVQAKLAEMALGIDASALLVYRAAWAKDTRGGRVTREAAMAKLHATESAQRTIDAAVQLLRRARRHLRPSGRGAVPRDPRAADLRGRVRGPAADHRPGAAEVTDTFARDQLPPREQWPDLLLLDGPERVNAAVELLATRGRRSRAAGATPSCASGRRRWPAR